MDKEILKKYNFNFNKKYGQNFIFDHNLLSAIVSDAQVENKNVLEIGPGAGGLTTHLCEKAKKVVAYEIDENLKPILQENLANYDNVSVVFDDIMNVPMNNIENNFDGHYIVVANLPYYITTPIIFKFIENATKLDKLVVMVQYEVALRLVADYNTADYGAITVAINTIADSKITRKVKRNMFVPAPNVDSAIVAITINRNKYKVNNLSTLRKLIKSAFAMRRKTLANNLKKDFELSNDKLKKLFEVTNINSGIRGEALSPEQFVKVANAIDEL